MKATKESVSPTRVKLTVEVPFEELKPSLDATYKKLAGQVRVQGFRPGKVPPRILDQRVGRGYVLDETLQDALPRFYSAAVQQEAVPVLSRPEVDVTSFADGEPLVFTAEVDVRPELELPDYHGLAVTVDDAEVGDDAVREQLDSMRDRFAVLTAAERPAAEGDYVSLDLSATVDGEPVPGADATGMSYEVGSGTLVPGIDEALVGAAEGETRTFPTELVAGEFAGRTAEVTVTVRSVKAKELPELDDDFATTASEFDTLAELEADVRTRLSRVRGLEQGVQARDRALEALVASVEVPVPESVVEEEVAAREQTVTEQLAQAGLTREDYLASEGRTQDELHAELHEGAEQAVKAQFVLDAIATKEQLSADDAELSDVVVRRAQRLGIAPDAYAQQVVESGNLAALYAEVVRGKALATVLESATVTDASGRRVDLEALRAPAGGHFHEDGSWHGDEPSPEGTEAAQAEGAEPQVAGPAGTADTDPSEQTAAGADATPSGQSEATVQA